MDIDIDFQSDFNPNTIFKEAIPASMVNRKDLLVKHPCGQYFQKMAIDPITGLAAIPYKEATVLGYFKIDFLHLSHIDPLTSKEEIRRLIDKEPNWSILRDRKQVEKLFHINNHFELLEKTNPHSINDLADVLALIRPSKRSLIDKYIKANTQEKIKLRKLLYQKPTTNEIWFKKSHSIAYALTIVLQLHLIEMNRL